MKGGSGKHRKQGAPKPKMPSTPIVDSKVVTKSKAYTKKGH